jgi:hypothetical protein
MSTDCCSQEPVGKELSFDSEVDEDEKSALMSLIAVVHEFLL